jgi:RNA polymerase sigma-70 factor (ECF subfamily)
MMDAALTGRSTRAHHAIRGTIVWVASTPAMCQTAAECVTLGWQPFGGQVREGRDERELVRRCREGSEAAYAELVRSHRPRLYLLAYRLVGDRETAEDVVQETFLAAFKSIEKVEPRPSLNPWLNTIVLRTAGRAASRRRSRPGPSLDQATRGHLGSDAFGGPSLGEGLMDLDPSGDPPAAAEAAELRRDLAAALVDLPFKYRAAVVLRHVMGLDYAEAASELGLPLNTFKSHLLRGTRLLREALAGQLDRPVPGPATAAAQEVSGNGASAGSGRRPGDVLIGSEQPLRR